jgi:hypothetical protein
MPVSRHTLQGLRAPRGAPAAGSHATRTLCGAVAVQAVLLGDISVSGIIGGRGASVKANGARLFSVSRV